MVPHRCRGLGARDAFREDPRPPRIIAPMLLAIDIGNTNVTIGLLRNRRALVATRAPRTNAAGDRRRAGARCSTACCASTTARSPTSTAIACASVVPALTAHVEAIAARRERPLVVGIGRDRAARVRRPPGEVGADRLVNALAAGAAVRDAGGRRRLRDGDDLRLRGRRRGVRRRGDRPGARAGPRGAGGADRQAAADRAAGPGPGDRPRHGERHAVRHGVRLPGAGRGPPGRIRRELAEQAGVAPADVQAILTGGLSGAPWARGLDGVDASTPT